MHKALVLGAVVAALGVAANAKADDGFSYSWLEADYVSADIDGVSSNPDGFGLSGSLAFSPMIHGYVDYTNLSTHGTTIEGWEIGLGLNHSLSQKLDLIGRIGYLKADVEGLGDEDGYAVQGGVRALPAANFELEGLLHYTDLGGRNGDDTSLRVNGRYFFAPQFAVGAGVEINDDDKIWNIGVRWNFNGFK